MSGQDELNVLLLSRLDDVVRPEDEDPSIISPLCIRFSQDNIRRLTNDKVAIEQLVQAIELDYSTGFMKHPFPEIEVHEVNVPGNNNKAPKRVVVSLDNRRLLALQLKALAALPLQTYCKVHYIDEYHVEKYHSKKHTGGEYGTVATVPVNKDFDVMDFKDKDNRPFTWIHDGGRIKFDNGTEVAAVFWPYRVAKMYSHYTRPSLDAVIYRAHKLRMVEADDDEVETRFSLLMQKSRLPSLLKISMAMMMDGQKSITNIYRNFVGDIKAVAVLRALNLNWRPAFYHVVNKAWNLSILYGEDLSGEAKQLAVESIIPYKERIHLNELFEAIVPDEEHNTTVFKIKPYEFDEGGVIERSPSDFLYHTKSTESFKSFFEECFDLSNFSEQQLSDRLNELKDKKEEMEPAKLDEIALEKEPVVTLPSVILETDTVLDVEDAPVEDAPVEDVPTEDVEPNDAPVEDAPVEDVPTEDAFTEDVEPNDAPVEDVPVEDIQNTNTVYEDIPVEDDLIEDVNMESGPTEDALIEDVQNTDNVFENYPVENYPVENYPVDNYPVDNYPVDNYPVDNYPVENYPVENYPVDNYPVGDYEQNYDINLNQDYTEQDTVAAGYDVDIDMDIDCEDSVKEEAYRAIEARDTENYITAAGDCECYEGFKLGITIAVIGGCILGAILG